MRWMFVSVTIKKSICFASNERLIEKVSFNRHTGLCCGSSPVLIKFVKALPQIERMPNLSIHL